MRKLFKRAVFIVLIIPIDSCTNSNDMKNDIDNVENQIEENINKSKNYKYERTIKIDTTDEEIDYLVDLEKGNNVKL
jgi:hypothetical protein